MLIKNNSKRLYTIAGVMVVPNGQAIEVPCTEADIAGLDDLEVVKAKQAPKADEDKSMTKAELQDALDAKKIEYPSTANKAELQALLDDAE